MQMMQIVAVIELLMIKNSPPIFVITRAGGHVGVMFSIARVDHVSCYCFTHHNLKEV